ncbi:hypothetical protein BJ085DRAFT_36902 [Dimargaris cristalligena]|uniref:Uncharacterized protein n=1 Tax=Dimargaris cristalligena TaxID=215637 RepID=A0A4Q0A125_9FUNG|nr:hypothetical protein BJ085DRAFT_36902 [Dimargaris cristalligena]|eukprot:RKP39724.1 hypothetical protein BJ085DRAFT_36902 [Dimargaris cristalligena]
MFGHIGFIVPAHVSSSSTYSTSNVPISTQSERFRDDHARDNAEGTNRSSPQGEGDISPNNQPSSHTSHHDSADTPPRRNRRSWLRMNSVGSILRTVSSFSSSSSSLVPPNSAASVSPPVTTSTPVNRSPAATAEQGSMSNEVIEEILKSLADAIRLETRSSFTPRIIINHYGNLFETLLASLFIIAARNHATHDSTELRTNPMALLTHSTSTSASTSPKSSVTWRRIEAVILAETKLVSVDALPLSLLVRYFTPLFVVKLASDRLLSDFMVALWTSQSFPLAVYDQLRMARGPMGKIVHGTLRPAEWWKEISMETQHTMVKSLTMLVTAYCVSRRRFAPLEDALRTLASMPRYAEVWLTAKGNPMMFGWGGTPGQGPNPILLTTLVLLDQSKFDLSGMIYRLGNPFLTSVYRRYFVEGNKARLIAHYQPYYQNDFFHYQMTHDFKTRVYWPVVPRIKKHLQSQESERYADVADALEDTANHSEPPPPYGAPLRNHSEPPPPTYDQIVQE